MKTYKRLIGNDNLEAEMSKLEKEDPAGADKIFLQYCKQLDENDKQHDKMKFGLHSIIREYKTREGLREHGEYEKMWEGEYLEWSKTAKAGYLTETEAKANWAAFKTDPKVAKDSFGPRGWLRCSIKVKDVTQAFTEASRDDSVRSESKLSKNLTEEQLQQKVGIILNHSGHSDPVNWNDIVEKGLSADKATENESLLDGVLQEPSIGDLRLAATAGKNKKAGGQQAQEADDPDGENGPGGTGGGKEQPAGQPEQYSWLDDTKNQ